MFPWVSSVRMGNTKCQNKNPKRRSGGRSHRNVCLNRWNEEAMLIAIQEYNNLCAQHGVDNVSIKAVVETMTSPPPCFGRGTHSWIVSTRVIVVHIVCSGMFCFFWLLEQFFSLRLNCNCKCSVLLGCRIHGVVVGIGHHSGGHGNPRVYSRGMFHFYTFAPCLKCPFSIVNYSINPNLLYILVQLILEFCRAGFPLTTKKTPFPCLSICTRK